MTIDRVAMKEVLEKGSDQDLLREMLAFVAPHVAAGDLVYREDIREGLETLPAAFAEMLKGGNFGKMLVRVSPDPTL